MMARMAGLRWRDSGRLTTILKTVVLWLFVINRGVAFGAGIYEARVVIAQ
jgi:hypothetical protein